MIPLNTIVFMLLPAALNQCWRQAHGPQVQAKDISYIAQKLETYETFEDIIGFSAPSLEAIIRIVVLPAPLTYRYQHSDDGGPITRSGVRCLIGYLNGRGS